MIIFGRWFDDNGCSTDTSGWIDDAAECRKWSIPAHFNGWKCTADGADYFYLYDCPEADYQRFYLYGSKVKIIKIFPKQG